MSEAHQAWRRAAAPANIEPILRYDLTAPDLCDLLPTVDFLISDRAAPIDRAVIAAAPRLRLIQRIGSLTHDIDLEAARAAGIPVAKWPNLLLTPHIAAGDPALYADERSHYYDNCLRILAGEPILHRVA